ncbi:MAG: aldo/keto reductase [Clostridiaceae bacterium]|nr:aldo/keto reductase [Clostridiaceae bacterium]
MSKLVLGTVQFGLDYGISNSRGKVPENEINSILQDAYTSGIRILDTASAYGSSEEVISKSQTTIGKEFSIISKYPVNVDSSPFAWIDTSLSKLHRISLYGYMFHNFEIYRKHPEYVDDLVKIKESNKAEKIGYSLYFPQEAETILKNNLPCDIIQIPYNIFDQRFQYLLPDLKKRNIEIHVRSIFLQGLFFMKIDSLSDFFDPVKEKLVKLHKYADEKKVSMQDICLGFVNSNPCIDHIVFGVDSLINLNDNIKSYENIRNQNFFYNDLEYLREENEDILLPGKWRK